jgi:hypothetical protein
MDADGQIPLQLKRKGAGGKFPRPGRPTRRGAYEPPLSAEMMSPNSSQFSPLNFESCIDWMG